MVDLIDKFSCISIWREKRDEARRKQKIPLYVNHSTFSIEITPDNCLFLYANALPILKGMAVYSRYTAI